MNSTSASVLLLLGDGIPGFPGKFPQRDFRLTECKAYSDGSVGLRYERLKKRVGNPRQVGNLPHLELIWGTLMLM